MVRIKTRWLLVRIDFVNAMSVSDTDVKDVTGSFPSKNELARVIRDHLIQCSGVACSGAALDTQGTSSPYGAVVFVYDIEIVEKLL
jgi:hypothetical protein